MTDKGATLDLHPEHQLIEATIRQPEHRQTIWTAVISDVHPDDGYKEREWVAYADPEEESDSGMEPIGDGSVIEVSVSGAVDTPENRWYYLVDLEREQLEEIDEDEVRQHVRDRVVGAMGSEESELAPTID